MDVLEWMRETLGNRDPARDNVCTALQKLGVRAELAERGRTEEEVTPSWMKSHGVIDVLDRQIGWVIVKSMMSNKGAKFWWVEYGVPDQRVAGAFPKVKIKTSPVRAKPRKTHLVGRVVGLRWKGVDSDLGIIRRLNDDVSLRQPLTGSGDLEIRAYPEHRCWVLIADPDDPIRVDPSSELWDSIETIAGHLLATPVPGREALDEDESD